MYFFFKSIYSYVVTEKPIIWSHEFLNVFGTLTWITTSTILRESKEEQLSLTEIVPSLKDLSYTDRLKKLNLETLEYRRTRADLLETYRIMNGIHELDLSCHCSICPTKKMFTPALHQSTRGHDRKLQVQEATGPRKHVLYDASNWTN